MKVSEDYMIKAEYYIKEHGEKTVLLMQIGSFYEIYSFNDEKCKLFKIIYDISDITGLAVVERSICVGDSPILAAGFHINYYDKWLHKIQMGGYTCVVYSQDNNCKSTTRSLTGIFTPGTYISEDDNKHNNNNNTCIWLEQIKNKLHVGLSNINLITGKSKLYEYIIENTNVPNIYDDIERYISLYNPYETIIITNLSSSLIDSIITYVNIKSVKINKIDLNDENNENTIKARKCEMQKYQLLIFSSFFNITNVNIFLESYNTCEIAIQGYCYLLNYLNGLNPNLISTISKPVIENLTDKLILANHSSKQLNIINENDDKKYSSVLNLTNNTVTSMGKRKYRENLLNPITNVKKLKEYYNITEHVLEENIYNLLRDNIKNIHDIERFTRLILLKKISIKNIYTLYLDLQQVKKVCNLINNYNWLESLNTSETLIITEEVILFIESYLDIDKCKDIYILEDNIFNIGVYSDLDLINERYIDSYDKILCIVNKFDKLCNDKIKPGNTKSKTYKSTSNYVKLNSTEKSGYSIQTTKTRVPFLENIIKENDKFSFNFSSKLSNKEKTFEINNNISINKINNSTTYNIESIQINNICKDNLNLKSELKNKIIEKYDNFLGKLSNFTENLYKISEFISNIDIIQNRAYTSNIYNFCKPDIYENVNSNLEATSLRHPIIEQINQEEIYVANNIKLDSENNILLFGTNAVGKTSLIKSIGIAIILAQSGMYVPASKFKYTPYKELFTRILNCDNIFKGLSTFTLEMSEMSNILKYSNKNSLVLGDELCSGTELPSAMCIFISGLKNLSNKKANFIFATHFHEMLEFEELNELSNVKFKHMTVKYDSKNDCVIYDRTLKDGSGDKIYGLEVCKSLHLPDDFMNDAFNILHKYYNNTKDMLSYKTSKYNSTKVKNKVCEMCKKKNSIDVHHLIYQSDSINNWINNDKLNKIFNINHNGNLIDVCEDCHNEIHKKDIKMVKRKTTSGIILEAI